MGRWSNASTPARPIETDTIEGWAFHELDQIDEAKGGAPRAHVDALRLLAVFLAHWDNKPENQRLVCLSQAGLAGGRALRETIRDAAGSRRRLRPPEGRPRRLASRADLGQSRRPAWRRMDSLPYEGATFEPVQVTEAGRRHLASLLGQLSDDQIEDLFTGARFDKKKSFLTAHGQADLGLGARLQGQGAADQRRGAVPAVAVASVLLPAW